LRHLRLPVTWLQLQPVCEPVKVAIASDYTGIRGVQTRVSGGFRPLPANAAAAGKGLQRFSISAVAAEVVEARLLVRKFIFEVNDFFFNVVHFLLQFAEFIEDHDPLITLEAIGDQV